MWAGRSARRVSFALSWDWGPVWLIPYLICSAFFLAKIIFFSHNILGRTVFPSQPSEAISYRWHVSAARILRLYELTLQVFNIVRGPILRRIEGHGAIIVDIWHDRRTTFQFDPKMNYTHWVNHQAFYAHASWSSTSPNTLHTTPLCIFRGGSMAFIATV